MIYIRKGNVIQSLLKINSNMLQAYQNGTLQKLLGDVKDAETYDYDLIIIGGGSGGLACSKV